MEGRTQTIIKQERYHLKHKCIYTFLDRTNLVGGNMIFRVHETNYVQARLGLELILYLGCF